MGEDLYVCGVCGFSHPVFQRFRFDVSLGDYLCYDCFEKRHGFRNNVRYVRRSCSRCGVVVELAACSLGLWKGLCKDCMYENKKLYYREKYRRLNDVPPENYRLKEEAICNVG